MADKFNNWVAELTARPNPLSGMRQATQAAAGVPTYVKFAKDARAFRSSMGLAAVGGAVALVGILNMSFGVSKLER